MTSRTLFFLALYFLGIVLSELHVNGQSCGGSYTYTSNSGVLQSPNYPNVYNNYCQCIYTISLSTTSSILLTFETFELDRYTLTGDYVTISCVSNSSYISRTYYWNSVTAPMSIPWCRSARITFQSDYYSSYPVRGFRIQYQVSTVGCGNTVYTETSGNITSPNYPLSYNNNENCTYSIWASQPSSFLLNFQSLYLESSGPNCPYDWVQILCDDTSYELPKLCGSTVPRPVSINSCNQVYIWFRTDVSAVYSGFYLQFFVTPNGCGQSSFAGLSGKITSPNYPWNFASMTCSYYVHPVSSMTLEFLSFDLEPFIDNSNGDYVRVDCISSASNGTPLRGKTLPPPVTFPQCSLIRVYFNANNAISGTGFSIQYQVKPLAGYGTITNKPLNIAAYVGSQEQLNCTSSLTSYLPSWTFSRDGTDTNATVIASFCVVNSEFTSQFSVSRDGQGTCNLLIANVTLTAAGVYTCIDVSLASFSSILSVIEVLPSEEQEPDVVRGDVLWFQYLVKFASSNTPAPTPPMLISWNATTGEIFDSSIINQPDFVISSHRVTAEPPIVPSYGFAVEFYPPLNSTDYADNVPTFTYLRYTTSYNVLYWPEANNMTIKGDNSGYIAYNGLLQCDVSSNPLSSYQWLDHAYGIYTHGSTISIKHDGIYSCNASNVIRNITYWSSKSINIHVLSSSTTNSIASTSVSSDSSTTLSTVGPIRTDCLTDIAVIVPSSLLGICVLGYIALILYHVIQRFRVKTNSSQDGHQHSYENRDEDTRNGNAYLNTPNVVRPPVYDNVPIPDIHSGFSKHTEEYDLNLYERLNHASRESTVYSNLT